MEVFHENVTALPSRVPQVAPSSQMQASMPSSLHMPSSIGLQQIRSSQGGQQMIMGGMNFSSGLGTECVGNGSQSGMLGGLPAGVRQNSLLRQSSSPAGLLTKLSRDAQGHVTKNEKQNSTEDSLSGGTSEENIGDTLGAWEDAITSCINSWGNDSFSARKRCRDNIDLGDMMVPSDSTGSGHGSLTRHMSLPAAKLKVMPEDILQSVPCQIRAKRGCATHTRSIAERVRRTRISERMRKLQDLVPNMDKQQTNTADMLDEAVEYVKRLQRQVQELTEIQAKCNGSAHQGHKTSTS